MNKRTIAATVAGALLVTGLAGGAVAVASGGDDGEGHVTGPQADQAIAAALAETDGGTANAVERDSEDGAVWEVEVTKPNGETVDVRLDADFHVVVVDGDREPAGDTGR